MLLPVTMVLAAACGAINLWLGLRLVRGRLGGIAVGDGGNPAMLAGMRSHANFVEYAPFVIILTALVELARGPSVWLWGLSLVFLVGRLLHPFGMQRPVPNPMRAGGAIITWLVTAILVGWALAIAWQAEIAAPLPQASVTVVPGA